ncbi:hypothetical protein [Humisphaera borealis]|uniref:Uncharacterized protein n=1 Tax=Humisphaera borealis TaxID=2807512 RepID=A0A7M2WZS6_9BACT|nr:hypothetical protein [Humisphaera borealis]QOV90903.1 hypothetical protein IPV69_05955 [Humisphaera borealis]
MANENGKPAPDTIERLAKRLVDDTAAALGGAWTGLSAADRETIRLCAVDAAGLQVSGLLARSELEKDIWDTEQRQINAQLLNIAAVGQGHVADAFWTAFEIAGKGLGILIDKAL